MYGSEASYWESESLCEEAAREALEERQRRDAQVANRKKILVGLSKLANRLDKRSMKEEAAILREIRACLAYEYEAYKR